MPDADQWRKTMRYASAGMEFTLTFGLLLAGGLLLDKYAHTKVVFTLVGAVLGFALGMYRLVAEARRAQRDLERKGQDDSKGPGEKQ